MLRPTCLVLLAAASAVAQSPSFAAPVRLKAGDVFLGQGRLFPSPVYHDLNGDGRQDLACGSMGDAYGNNEGGGVVLFLNTGTGKAASFGAPITLLERSKKGAAEPTRPDSGLYMDFGDHDGDGDLDMVVGAYSHWTPKPRELSAEETKRLGELKAEHTKVEAEMQELEQTIEAAVKDLTGEAADAKRNELFKANRDKFTAIGKRGQVLQQEIDLLVPGAKRMSFVWLYENTRVVEATAPRK